MDKHAPSRNPNEFSRTIEVGRLEQGEVAQSIEADAAEREALARRFGLLTLDRLSAEVILRRVGHGPVVRVEGRLSADVAQSCVVSLEPVASRIEQDFVLLYAPEKHVASMGHVLEEDGAEMDDWPEPFEDGRIDIGEAVAQQLALALDPYPRRPEARLDEALGGKGRKEAKPAESSPFAVLARLRRTP